MSQFEYANAIIEADDRSKIAYPAKSKLII